MSTRHLNRRRDHRLVALVALAFLAGTTAGCGEQSPPPAPVSAGLKVDQALRGQLPEAIRAKGELRIGTDASYAPMASFAPDGRTIIGMEPDLAAQVGLALGVRVTFVHADFGTLLDQVASGQLDLAMSAITDTAERGRQVDFVNYFSAGTAIVVQRGNPAGITGIRDLCGHVVAVEADTTQVDLLARTQRNCGGRRISVKEFATNSDALLELRTGRAAAVLNDLPPAAFLTSAAKTKSQYQLASTTQYEPAPYGIVVAKSQPGLRDAVQGALQTAYKAGVYADIMKRWNVTSGAVDQITINSGR
jgi:polar amino acid transport system substrate-binding protein